MTVSVSQVAGRLFPAVPVPFDRDGRLHDVGLGRYAAWMAGQPVGGVAVWAHTGRGLHLSEGDAARVLSQWRRELSEEQVLIAAAGARADCRSPAEVLGAVRSMARRAADLGADALLVHPPTAFRERADRDTLILDYHSAAAEAGLPLIAFYLYEAAGGISYPPELLATLLAREDVLGVKMATLDSVMTFQDIARLLAAAAPGKLIITGEDRFLGYSLLCGARAALIGMAAACTGLQAELLRAHRDGDAARFLRLSSAVDDLAQHTFIAPMEGYIRRMLWCLAIQGVIPDDAAHDPWGPPVDPDEFERLRSCLGRLSALEPVATPPGTDGRSEPR
jgi:4-hydroxy-tetrahydrodipicolinate synthase